MLQPEPPQQGCWQRENEHMLPFHAHAGMQMPALSYTIIHLELSLMLQVSSLADFSPTQRELPLCWLNTADRRKREAKMFYLQIKNILLSPNCTKYQVHYVKMCSWWFLGQNSLPPLSASLQQTNQWEFSCVESWQDLTEFFNKEHTSCTVS